MKPSSEIKQDIEWLDAALWRVVEEQHGRPLADKLAGLFHASQAPGGEDPFGQVARRLRGYDGEALRAAIRFAAIRLDLMNLAEDRFRLQTLSRRSQDHPRKPRRGSIADAAAQLRRRPPGCSPAEALRRLSVELVLTAHPTDAKRRTIRHGLREVRSQLDAHNEAELTEERRMRIESRLHAALTAVWQTDLVRPVPPTVRQEIQRGLNVARRLWSVVPRIDRDLREALEQEISFDRAVPLRFGSWIGGDRDGHPLVTVRETVYALRAGRRLALRLHARTAIRRVLGLSLSTRKQPVDTDLRRRVDRAVRRWPALAPRVEADPETELYRRFGRIIHWRLLRTLRDREGAYEHPGELLDDVRCIHESLCAHRAHAVAAEALADWIVQIRTFGFHMLALDVRQDSRVYAEVIDELLRKTGAAADYLQSDEARRRILLERTRGRLELNGLKGLSEAARQTLDLFRLLRRRLARCPESIGGHVISMTHQVSDVLAVPWLLAAVRGPQERQDPSLQVIPLFETISDLDRCRQVLNDLFAEASYRRLLDSQGRRQTVMIGYSDSTKDGGYLAACWRMYQAQIAMHEVADAHGVDLSFFHGRGGSLGRGGGPAARSIKSLPAHTVNGRIRITEQGEVLVDRYDDRRIGYRHLEQIVAATLLTIGDGHDRTPARWTRLLAERAASALQSYRSLVEDDAFLTYFRMATPIDEIEQLQIGSRPSRRRMQRSLEDLRAIPWVFAWTQSRHMIPAWYGLGGLLPATEDREQIETLRVMYERWGFFRATIDNAALAFAKLQMDIVRRYAGLVPEAARSICDRVETEAARVTEVIGQITGFKHILDNTEWLRDSVEARNPWVCVLNLAQVLLLRRLRSGELSEHEAEDARELVRKTIYGVASGLRSTG